MKEPKKRELNMEEKSKLQKLLFSDIDAALQRYQTRRAAEHTALKDRLTQNPAPEIVALAEACRKAEREKDEKDRALAQAGYSFFGYGDTRSLGINYSRSPKELADFDAETKRNEREFAEVKRDYTLRLFAGGAEAQSLFAELTRSLEKIA